MDVIDRWYSLCYPDKHTDFWKGNDVKADDEKADDEEA
jgi:hypothetical protein